MIYKEQTDSWQNKFHFFVFFCSIKTLDVHVVVDSIADIMSHEDKDFCKYGHLAITILFETASLALRSQIDAARLPFFEYLAGKDKTFSFLFSKI